MYTESNKSLISSLNISNFKMFENFHLKGLKRINLIYGKNNSGKTGLLESIYLSLSLSVPDSIFSILRGFPISISSNESSWKLIFYNFDNAKHIQTFLKFEDGNSVNFYISQPFINKHITISHQEIQHRINSNSLYLKWEYRNEIKESIINIAPISPNIQDNPFLQQNVITPQIISVGKLSNIKPVFFFTSLGKPSIEMLNVIYGEIVRKDLKRKLISCLKEIDNSIEDVDIINIANINCVSIKRQGQFYPVDSFGEGFAKIFTVISLILDKQDGVILIDEIENGIYWEIQGKFWKYIEKFSEEYNVQIFATTHSYEFIENAINSIENLESICGIKLKEQNGQITYVMLQGLELAEMVKERFEVR